MADKRYEMNVIFHSGLSEEEIVDAFWERFGDNASVSVKQIHDWPAENPADPAGVCGVKDCPICGGPALGGWVDLTKQPVGPVNLA